MGLAKKDVDAVAWSSGGDKGGRGLSQGGPALHDRYSV